MGCRAASVALSVGPLPGETRCAAGVGTPLTRGGPGQGAVRVQTAVGRHEIPPGEPDDFTRPRG